MTSHTRPAAEVLLHALAVGDRADHVSSLRVVINITYRQSKSKMAGESPRVIHVIGHVYLILSASEKGKVRDKALYESPAQ